MLMKKITISIIGLGNRGKFTYGKYFMEQSDKFEIVSICDTNNEQLKSAQEYFHIDDSCSFNDEDTFFNKKRSDLLVVSTQDDSHVRVAKKGLLLGYDILLEKPISKYTKELRELLELSKRVNCKVVVCHVLRYTAFIRKIKELLDQGLIGRLLSINHTENVIFWHQAHSFVRGNWRREEDTTPMIMAKCCHDLDLITYFANSKCEYASSIGELTYFKKENQPKDAAHRCTDCKYIDTCPYSAKRIYIDKWKNEGSLEEAWPYEVICSIPLTEEKLYKAIKETPYGRCVFECDNDVVDHQMSIMKFANGVIATLDMEAFTAHGGRRIRLMGEKGEILADEFEDYIIYKPFFGENVKFVPSQLTDDLSGHSGGDHRMMDMLYNYLNNEKCEGISSLENSIESHYIALALEESRLHNGKSIKIDDYRKEK